MLLKQWTRNANFYQLCYNYSHCSITNTIYWTSIYFNVHIDTTGSEIYTTHTHMHTHIQKQLCCIEQNGKSSVKYEIKIVVDGHSIIP